MNKPALCLDSCMPNKHIPLASTYSVQHLHHILNAHICIQHATQSNNQNAML